MSAHCFFMQRREAVRGRLAWQRVTRRSPGEPGGGITKVARSARPARSSPWGNVYAASSRTNQRRCPHTNIQSHITVPTALSQHITNLPVDTFTAVPVLFILLQGKERVHAYNQLRL
jgi:hypothetical protein